MQFEQMIWSLHRLCSRRSRCAERERARRRSPTPGTVAQRQPAPRRCSMTNVKRTVRLVGLVTLGIALAAMQPHPAAAQSDPHVGTWVLNVAKSSYTPGPGPKAQTSVYTSAGDGLKVAATGTSADGTPTKTDFSIVFDAKDHPATGNPDWDAVSSKRVDSHTIDFTRKKAGKVVQTGNQRGVEGRQDAHRHRDRRQRPRSEDQDRRRLREEVEEVVAIGGSSQRSTGTRAVTDIAPSPRLRRGRDSRDSHSTRQLAHTLESSGAILAIQPDDVGFRIADEWPMRDDGIALRLAGVEHEARTLLSRHEP